MPDTRFSSSFIPKTPVVGTALQKEPMGLLAGIAGLIFLLSLLSVGGVFGYRKVLENKIEEKQAELAMLESQVNRQEIARLVSFDKKIDSTREVLTNHVAITNFFKMIEKNTVVPLSYTNLKYSAPSGKNITVSMDGKAPNYRMLSEQQRVFLADSNTVSADYKTMTFDKTKGQTTFSFNGEFNKNLVRYGSLDAAAAAPKATTTPASTAATTTKATTTPPANN